MVELVPNQFSLHIHYAVQMHPLLEDPINLVVYLESHIIFLHAVSNEGIELNKPPCIWMLRIIENFIYCSHFNNSTAIHNRYTICNVCNNTKIMCDENNRCINFLLQDLSLILKFALELLHPMQLSAHPQ